MPCGFDEIIGQDNIKSILLSSIKLNKVNHAYILEGEKGMGKKSIAYTFAKYLVCNDSSACGKCSGCTAAKAGTHPDIITVSPAEGKKAIGVEDIREIVSSAAVKPYTAKKKVIILSNCDGMTAAAQNALLKVLEEPPEYIVFLLLIQNSNYLLETVRSRSIKLTLQPYKAVQIKQGLERYANADISKFSYIISYAENNIGKAVTLAQDEDFAKIRNAVLGKIPLITSSNQLDIYELIKLFEEQKDNANILFDCLLSVVRDMILMKNGCENMIQNTDFESALTQIEGKFSMQSLIIIISDIIKTKEMLSRNTNYNLTVSALLNGSWEVVNGRNSRSVF